MPIPELTRRSAEGKVLAFIERRIPPDLRDEIRLEHTARGNAITIVERRPPWLSELGPDWTSMKIAQLRYDPDDRTWTLYCRDRNERWFLYDDVKPSRDVSPLLAEIDEDPTCIFWG